MGRQPECCEVALLFGDTYPTRVLWLDDDQVWVVRVEAIGIEKLIVHLEPDLRMRRIELLHQW
jgi:hypothetical protein